MAEFNSYIYVQLKLVSTLVYGRGNYVTSSVQQYSSPSLRSVLLVKSNQPEATLEQTSEQSGVGAEVA